MGRQIGRIGRRAVPWARVLAIAAWVVERGREAWYRLTPHERRELQRLVSKSRGRRLNLTERERRDLWRIVRKALGVG
jgi:DNA-binding PadR family transcriptional regulator